VRYAQAAKMMPPSTMDFAPSSRTQSLHTQLQRFMDDLVLPSLADWHRYADAGV
jgi:hypothetical protein